MTAKYDIDQQVEIVKVGEYQGMIGTIQDRSAVGLPMATGFGRVEWLYTIRFENGKKHRFYENDIRHNSGS